MIDRRAISYTQGHPLSPVHKGVLLQTADPFPEIAKGELISRAPTTPKKNGGIVDVISTLGVGGLVDVYISGGAFGSKEATKTVITEYVKGKDLPIEPLEALWETEEFKEWQPKVIIPVIGEIPSIQIDPITLDPLGWLPSWDDIKIPLIIAGGAVAGLFLLGKFIGRKS